MSRLNNTALSNLRQEYEQMKILEREREMAEKLQFMKTQKEIIQKARL